MPTQPDNMRTLFLLATSLHLCAALHAQAPQRISYQSVLRDGNGMLIQESSVGMRISLLQGSDDGPAIYVESHVPQTNVNGLATLEIGGGVTLSGSFQDVDWSAGPWFLKSETDPDGGTDYTIMGTAPLLSVPYALYAANSEPGPQGPMGPPGTSDCPIIRTADGRAVVYTGTTAHGLGLSGTGGTQWYNTSVNGEVMGSIASDSAVVLYTGSMAYGFGISSTGGSIWASTSLTGAPVGALAAMDRIVVFTDTHAYGYGRSSTGSTTWSTTTIQGPVVDHVVAGDRIMLITNTHAYGYAKNAIGGSAWVPTQLGSVPLGGAGTR